MTSKRKWFWYSVAFAIVVSIISLTYKSLTAFSGSGVASNISEVPYVGNHLKDLRLGGDIKYVYSRLINRPVRAILFTAEASSEDLGQFFGERLEPPYGNTHRKWAAIFKTMNVDPCDFPVGISDQDLVAYKSISVGNKTLVIRATYRKEDRKLTAYILEICE